MRVGDINASVPANIDRIIEAKGLKQNAVAERAGFSKQQLSAMLNGRRIIKVCDVLAIADALGVEVNELFATHDDRAS